MDTAEKIFHFEVWKIIRRLSYYMCEHGLPNNIANNNYLGRKLKKSMQCASISNVSNSSIGRSGNEMADYADIDAALTSHAQSVRRGRSNSHNSGSHSKGHKATKRTRKGGQSRLKGHRQRDNEASSEFFKRPSRGRDAVPSRELLGLGKPRPHKTPFASVGASCPTMSIRPTLITVST